MSEAELLPWQPTRPPLDEDAASRLIAAACPDLGPVQARRGGEGFDFEIFRVGDLAFRFPKRAAHEERLLKELPVLRALEGRLSLPIPVVRRGPLHAPGFPWAFAALTWIEGEVLVRRDPAACDLDAIGSAIGGLLRELETFPLADIGAARECLPEGFRDPVDWVARQRDKVAALAAIGGVALARRMERYAADPGEIPDRTPDLVPRLSHGDLHHEHVLVDPRGSEVLGVLDFGDACVAYPDTEFAGLFPWGGDALLDAVCAGHGQVSDESRARARHVGIWLCVIELAYYTKVESKRDYVRPLLQTLDASLPA